MLLPMWLLNFALGYYLGSTSSLSILAPQSYQ